MKNINREVWRYIDNNLPVKRNLADGVINIRALAKKIIKDINLNCSLTAVISAIRRYDLKIEKIDYLKKIHALLKNARLFTKTKLVAVLLKKNENIRKKIVALQSEMDFQGGDILRIFEVSKYIKLIIDEKTLDSAKKIFTKTEIVFVEKNIGELDVIYNADITKTPGLFAYMSNELAANNISIMDSMICHSEHIIIVQEKDIQKTFDVVFRLIKGS